MMKAKEQKEFLSAYELFSDPLFRFCYFKTGDRELALDMLQDIFMKTWNYIYSGNKIENFKAFLYRTATNIVIDWYRKKKTESLENLTENGFEVEAEGTETSLKAEFEQALSLLAKLPEDDGEIIYLRYVDDLSPKEIGMLFGEKENNISVKLHRAVNRLRDLMQ